MSTESKTFFTEDSALFPKYQATVRTFESGATRSGGDKPEYAGYMSSPVVIEFGKYMFKHQIQADGTIRASRNWQKGIPLESYMQSMFRHFIEVWNKYERGEIDAEMLESLMALKFNVDGMSHEVIQQGVTND